jgi:hypothetical protein
MPVSTSAPIATRTRVAVAALFGGALAAACGSGASPAQPSTDAAIADVATGTPETEASADPAIGQCAYKNPFSNTAECKSYTGAGWSVASATADCGAVLPGAKGTFSPGGCSFPAELGRCVVTNADGTSFETVDPGTDSSNCSDTKLGCEQFAKGSFVPGNTCAGVVTGSTGPAGGGAKPPFVQPYRVCKAPKAGEPAGTGPGGQVCTWTLISGCTEAGRHFEDYASCDDVRTQRPYYSVAPNGVTAAGDPRLSDPAYMAEINWARTQVEAAACVCCHSKPLAPKGPGEWFIESPGVWLDSVTDSGLAMMAGLAKSDALGAFPPAQNNGFDRTTLGIPTTDIPRMQKLMLAEYKRRGLTAADAAKVPAFGGPLVTQQAFVPKACAAGEGLDSAGKLVWNGGPARYLYVMRPDSKAPIVPPNLDEPAGTLWLAQVPNTATPFASGVTYGSLVTPMVQRLPSVGAPPALVSGTTYYLYALKVVAVPLARCLFTAR